MTGICWRPAADVLTAVGRRADAVIDTANLGAPAARLVRHGGTAVRMLPTSLVAERGFVVRDAFVLYHLRDRARPDGLIRSLAAGEISPRAATVISPKRVAEARGLLGAEAPRPAGRF